MKIRRSPIPAGTISPFGGGTVPSGWLLCDGSTVSRELYPALFAAISTYHGSGDGSTTFHLPDYRGRFLRGHDDGAGRDSDRATRTASNSGGNTGDNVGSVQDRASENHTHYMFNAGAATPSDNLSDGGQMYVSKNPNGSTTYASYIMTKVNGTQPTYGIVGYMAGVTGAPPTGESRPQNANVLYIIKY